ncbi:DUF4105 domain-containing protein [Arenimonas sp. GDDSR-1]|uniref:lipoprotein N-acyltransferase Lnb domain-containing protein n=1 Tax=Arenimonas sp. GDDSR-1 TaxID=2950125 RepID=UPI0026224E03|nr:DUF4105 domain-containing protein [Arenimonas sp. GDDSR-1]
MRRWFVLLLGLLFAGQALAELRVGVMTMQPGAIFWERFGHNAIVIDDGKRPMSYNFGFFDPTESGFAGNFVKGRMNYILAALPLEQDLDYYRRAGRGVSIQWLDLDAAQKQNIRARLEFLAKPENARYRYDYFTNNCATQVRDVLDAALDGGLKRQMVASSLGNTYRSESVRLAWPAKWMALGFDLGMGRAGDAPLNRWQDAFIPMRLQQSLREAKGPNGGPLVLAEQSILPDTLPPPPAELAPWTLTAAAIGLALAGLFFWMARHAPRLATALQLGFWGLCGLIGTLLLLIWVFTEHRFAYSNENLLLFSPLAGLALVLYSVRKRSEGLRRAYVLAVKAVALSAVIAVLLKFGSTGGQSNMVWILMTLPLHWLVARTALQAEARK